MENAAAASGTSNNKLKENGNRVISQVNESRTTAW